ncbi:hypothetical protein SAMN04515647_3601 [Cohaesibacter sp. ES.047]|uniref:hypothetical protein n=1 Tax=Cohaesibacter sp. ES.047 TaxID=1798205 RepID=UPI000BC042FB|nr:hypothetical protein [Cohaesibacter sp. ES.047]SNY93309.1 hypothetical protein SAMN04515647_3601 [Cohaesibacter sp. ES.047]
MATLTKTQLMVATGILICVLGLSFIAMSESSALSDGYGTPMTLSSVEFSLTASNDECVAIKGSQGCEVRNVSMF